jgi:putative addiction module killer protein
MGKKIVKYYETEEGESPFIKWLKKQDITTRTIIIKYVERVANGSSSNNIKSLKNGIYEIKIFYGAGLRVYFAEEGECIILLLIGGDKSTQTSDTNKAKKYWRNYDRTK